MPTDLSTPTKEITRGQRWFDCGYCDKTFRDTDLSKIRKRGAEHLNKEHGDQLSRQHDRVETEEWGGDHIHENTYQIKRVDIYITQFDLLAPVSVDGYLAPSQADSVCDNCGARVTHDSDLEKVEKEPDSVLNDEWECSACINQRELSKNSEVNKQITEFGD